MKSLAFERSEFNSDVLRNLVLKWWEESPQEKRFSFLEARTPYIQGFSPELSRWVTVQGSDSCAAESGTFSDPQ